MFSSFSLRTALHPLLLPGHLCIIFGMIGMGFSLQMAVSQPPGQYPWVFPYGNGSMQNPYTISSCDQLQAMQYAPDLSYALVKDIDCSPTAWWNEGAGFFPIGYYGVGFAGDLDGRGFTVQHLFINRPSTDYTGVFGKIGAAGAVHDLNISVDVHGREYVGGLAGWVVGGAVNRVHVSGRVAGHNAVGGLAGVNEGIMRYVWANAQVSGEQWVGGIAGLSYASSVLADTVIRGSVEGKTDVGGVTGIINGSFSGNCTIAALVHGNEHVGWIAGKMMQHAHAINWIQLCSFLEPAASVSAIWQSVGYREL
ncbi:MAG: hypothetical protein JWM56_323 [Candidatus Peribacteria bacterium]|nr:hypothetical protein [Candidatus Peribacteria bacterium]